MSVSDRILFENEAFRLYSIYEDVYLLNKSLKAALSQSAQPDIVIASIYGDPDSGLIAWNNAFVALAGCGLSLYFLETGESYSIGAQADNTLWTEGIYQSAEDEVHFVRFTAYTKDNKIRVHRLNVLSREIEEL